MAFLVVDLLLRGPLLGLDLFPGSLCGCSLRLFGCKFQLQLPAIRCCLGFCFALQGSITLGLSLLFGFDTGFLCGGPSNLYLAVALGLSLSLGT